MVEARPGHSSARMVAAVALALAAGGGCGWVPRHQLDECHKFSRSLQSETAALKDETLKLRSHNQDLAERAVEDARRLKELDEDNQRLERSVLAYQDERDQIASAFEQFKQQITASIERPPTASRDRFESFTRQYAGVVCDASTATCTVPAILLFEPRSDQLTGQGKALLEAYARLLDDAERQGLVVTSTPEPADPAVRRVSTQDERADQFWFAAARAAKVREALASMARIDPARIAVETRKNEPATKGPPGITIKPRPQHQDPAPAAASPSRVQAADSR